MWFILDLIQVLLLDYEELSMELPGTGHIKCRED